MTFPTEQQVEAVERIIHREETGDDVRCGGCEIIARAALAALADEWREMERDAERYRWLRRAESPYYWAAIGGQYLKSGERLDAAIDAAREREG